MTVTATFAVELKDEASGAANSAASSLEALRKKIDEDVKALREMQKAMRNLKGGTSTSAAAHNELRDRIAAQKAAIATAQSKYLQLGGTFGKTATSAAATSSSFAELTGALQGSGGALGAVGGGLARLGPLLTNPITLVVALAAAFLALGTAIIAATAALLRYGVVQSDARRNEALQIEGLNTLRHWYGRTTASVEEFQAAIDRASDSTNVGRGTLQEYTRQLSRAGLRGDALTEAVEAMGIAAMVQGDRGAARFRALAINARLTGGSVRALAEDYRNRLGPIARRQMLSLDNQTARLRRSLDRIFSGLRIEGFLSALDQVLSLFSQSTATGRALKAIVEALFQPMIDQVEFLGPILRRFFQGFVIGALLMTIAILKVRNWLRDTFGGTELFENVDMLNVALYAGIAAFALFAAALAVIAIGFGLAALAVGLFVLSLIAVPLLLGAIAFAIGFAIGALVDWFQETDFRSLASDMIDGIVEGIRSGTSSVIQAVRNLATSATGAFRSALGIASPSSVFAGFGLNVAQGVSQGVDMGRPTVEDSVAGLVEVPQGGGVGGSVAVSIGDVVVNAGASNDPRELAVAFRDELASILEGVSIEMGAT